MQPGRRMPGVGTKSGEARYSSRSRGSARVAGASANIRLARAAFIEGAEKDIVHHARDRGETLAFVEGKGRFFQREAEVY